MAWNRIHIQTKKFLNYDKVKTNTIQQKTKQTKWQKTKQIDGNVDGDGVRKGDL